MEHIEDQMSYIYLLILSRAPQYFAKLKPPPPRTLDVQILV